MAAYYPSSTDPSCECRTLAANQGCLESFLVNVDTLKFAVELLKHKVITRETKERFASLDPDYLESDIRVRYLLQLVCEGVRENKKAFDRLIRVLSRLGQGGRGVCEAMRIELEEMKGGKDSERVWNSKENSVTENDVPNLTEMLVTGSYKWEEIGIALKLPKHILVGCGRGDSDIIKLNNLLTAWSSGRYEGSRPATLESLRTALASQIVGLGRLANKIGSVGMTEKYFFEAKRQDEMFTPEVTYQSYDTEVSEGKSTLLEVQVSCDGCESYQWSKDGQPLLDGADFSGVSSNILYVNRASQGTEGKYSCTVSNGDEAVCSDDVSLKVLYPPEKKNLLELYSLRESEVPKDSWPPVSSSTFVNLVLVKQESISKCNYYTVRGDVDDILKSKEKVTYEEVFSEYRKGTLILMEGRPGSGKTTLVHKITRDWTKERHILQGAKAVFLITLRLLNFTGKDKNLSDILEEFYSGESVRKSVEHDLQENGGMGVCFILDGLDEYLCKSEEESVIHRIMYKKFLPFSMVIVASRPVATDKLRGGKTRRIEVIGFTKSQIYEYIQTYPFTSSEISVSEKVSGLKTYLHQHPNVLHMCYLPVHAAMICFLFGELGNYIPHRETQIYEQFTIATLLRQKKRGKNFQQLKYLNDLEGKEKEDFQSICQLAFDMVIKSQQIINRSEAPVSLSDLSSSVLSLLTVEHTYRTHGDEHLYSFHHLTFQEFLAAYHIAELEEQEQIQIINEFKHVEKKVSQSVLKFYVGWLGIKRHKALDNEEILLPLFHRFGVNLDTFRLQCAFESQLVKMCDWVIEDGCLTVGDLFSSYYLTSSDFAALGYVISAASKLVSKLKFEHCTWDTDGVMAISCMDTMNKVHSIRSLEIKSYNSKELQSLLNLLPGLKELNLKDSLSEEDIKSLTSNVKLCQLKILKIRLPLEPPCSNPEEILNLLQFGSHEVEQVYVDVADMDSCNFTLWRKWLSCAFCFQVFVDSDTSWICLHNSDVFPSLYPERFSYCTDVVLVSCGIDDEGAELLASMLNTSVLENIVLDCNRISDSGAVALAGCMSRCSVLQEVCMECNFIGDSGATALASALFGCSSLRSLNLQGNAISDKGAVALAKAAEDKPHIDLCLHNVSISEEGITNVLKVRSRTKIRNVEFRSCQDWFSHADIDVFTSTIKMYGCVPVDMSITSIGGIKAYVEELKLMKNAKRLQFYMDINDDTLPILCDFVNSMSNLEHLQCKLGDPISSASAHLLSETLRTLKYTSLSFRHLSGINSTITDIVKCCNNLHSLDLSHHSLGLDDLMQLFGDSKTWFNLHTLNLNNCDIGSNGVQVLNKVLTHCNDLRYLDLGSNGIDDSGGSYLVEGLKDHTSLLGLTLGHNKIASDGVAALAPVFKSNRLLELKLSWCKIGSEGVAALMEVICTDTLQTLELANVGMGLEGVVALSAGLKSCRHLVRLGISRNNIGSHGMSSLAEGLQHCTNLQVLGLSESSITSDAVTAIVTVMKTCKYLKDLYLEDNLIFADDVADLVEGWQHKNTLKLSWLNVHDYPNHHELALHKGQRCCSSCDHLLEVYNNNDYVVIQDIPKLISRSNIR